MRCGFTELIRNCCQGTWGSTPSLTSRLQVVTVSSHRGLWPTAAPGGEEGYSEEARRLLPQAIPMNNEWFSAKEQTTEIIYNIQFPQITILMIDFRKWSTEGFHCHIIIWKPSTECRLLRLGNEGGKLVMDEGDIVKPEQYRWWSSHSHKWFHFSLLKALQENCSPKTVQKLPPRSSPVRLHAG